MANFNFFQRLDTLLMGKTLSDEMITKSPEIPQDAVLFSTNNKKEYEQKLADFKQKKLLAYQWVKAGQDAATQNLHNYTAIKLLYRDCDLMDGCPEISSALDIIAEEICNADSEQKMLTVKSSSKRVKSILEDLYYNRLNLKMWLPMIARATVKYGNDFHLLNISKDEGVLGWRELPVYEIDRVENGFGSAYSYINNTNTNDIKEDEVSFIWNGVNETIPYKNWQIAHFRLLNDSFFLPYGCSHLHKIRRAWRMWSMMEDAMLIHRLDKSVERRVFKIYVGGIDDSDVESFVNQVANNFKRGPMIDPETGQIDLRKNFLDVSSDYFIPVRDMSAPTPIETLQGANGQQSMEDIKYMQNKIFAGLRVPKEFLNFQDSQGKNTNLSNLDVRFARMIIRFQYYLLSELQKIGQIHLYLLGLKDEISNFSLGLYISNLQIEAAELDLTTKRLNIMQTALSDPGNGLPMMSFSRALKKIMGMTEDEIKNMLLEIRLERAIAEELKNTSAIIKSTGLFNKIDRIYGDFDAMNNPQPQQPMNNQNDEGLGIGGGGLGGGLSTGLDSGFDSLGQPGTEMNSDVNGGAFNSGVEDAPGLDSGNLMESLIDRYYKLINEKSDSDKEGDAIDSDIEKSNNEIKLLFERINKIIK